MRINSFRTRVLIGVLAPILLCQALVYMVTMRVVRDSAIKEIESSLEVTLSQFESSLEMRFQSLRTSAKLLSADYAFKQAYATHDTDTINSALENHQTRIGANTMFLVNLEGELIGKANDEFILDKTRIRNAIQTKNDEEDTRPLTAKIKRKLFKFIIVPLKAPTIAGWIFLGFAIDQHLADELKTSARSDISFIETPKGESANIIASTVPAEQLTLILKTANQKIEDGLSSIEFNQDTLLLISRTEKTEDGTIQFVLQKSLLRALMPFKDLSAVLVLIFCLCAVLFIFIALLISVSISKPISKITKAAISISKGDYSFKLPSSSTDEIGQLANSFYIMSRAIESEQRQKTQAYESLRKSHHEQSALYEIAKSTNFIIDNEKIMQIVSQKLLDLFNINSVVFFLRSKKNMKYSAIFQQKQGESLPIPEEPAFTKSIATKVVKNTETDDLQELFLNPEFIKDISKLSVRMKVKETPYVAVHLFIANQHLGTIFLEEESSYSISIEHLPFLETIASHAALIIQSTSKFSDSILDETTGIFNRKFFDVQLEREIHRATRHGQDLTLATVEIDNFKKISQKIRGQIFAEISQIFQDKLRKTDWVCRITEECIGILLSGTGSPGALQTMEKIKKQIEERKWKFPKGTLQVTVSIGMSTLPEHTHNGLELLNHSNTARAQALSKGGNKCEKFEFQ